MGDADGDFPCTDPQSGPVTGQRGAGGPGSSGSVLLVLVTAARLSPHPQRAPSPGGAQSQLRPPLPRRASWGSGSLGFRICNSIHPGPS